MRGIILFSALALVHGNVIEYNSNGCPRDYSKEKLLPHDDCTKYYQCSNGIKFTRVCASGLYFDATRKECNWPTLTNCHNKIHNDVIEEKEIEKSLDSSDPSHASEICTSPDSNGFLVAHENCNQFYKCAFGSPVAQRCPSNLLYHPNKELCDWPENVDCGSRGIPDINENEDNTQGNGNTDTDEEHIKDINDDPGQAPVICEAEGSDGILVAHEHCNKFYKCSFGKPVALKCQLNLLYHPEKEQCDWPENVNCGYRIIPEDDSNENDNGGNGSENNEISDIDGEDTESDDVKDINDDPSQAPTICKAESSDGVLVAHEHCNKYYKCSYGHPVALKCQLDLLYQPAKEYCDWPANVDCGDRIIPEEENQESNDNGNGDDETHYEPSENVDINDDPSAAPAICKSDGSEGVLVAHEYCNKFYQCSHGRPVAMICQINLLYNPAKKYCDWPANVNCGYRIIPKAEDEHKLTKRHSKAYKSLYSNPSNAPALCAAEQSEGKLVAHENCNQFYKCSLGYPVAMKCPGNLLYNTEEEYCDWTKNVVCGDRTIPDNEDDTDKNDIDDSNENDSNTEDLDNNNSHEYADPSKAPEICAAEGSNGVLVAHEKCNKFYKCFNGHPVGLLCPSNLLYNPKMKYCDWPQAVDCGDRIFAESNDENTSDKNNDQYEIPDQEVNSDPSEAAKICAADGSDGVLVAHETCNKFYKCSFGQPVALDCPDNLFYNPNKKYCDWAQNVDCSGRIQDSETVDKSEEKVEEKIDDAAIDHELEVAAACASSSSTDQLVPHKNCDQFYKCVSGVPVAVTCPKGLFFNPNADVCDWPSNVDCSNRTKRAHTQKTYFQLIKPLKYVLRVY